MAAAIKCIDLNSDLGESYGRGRMGDDTAMLSIVTSANGFVTLNNPAARFVELVNAEQAKMRAFLLN